MSDVAATPVPDNPSDAGEPVTTPDPETGEPLTPDGEVLDAPVVGQDQPGEQASTNPTLEDVAEDPTVTPPGSDASANGETTDTSTGTLPDPTLPTADSTAGLPGETNQVHTEDELGIPMSGAEATANLGSPAHPQVVEAPVGSGGAPLPLNLPPTRGVIPADQVTENYRNTWERHTAGNDPERLARREIDEGRAVEAPWSVVELEAGGEIEIETPTGRVTVKAVDAVDNPLPPVAEPPASIPAS